MKKNPGFKTTGVLMIFSILLLVLFLTKWITSQYDEEKKALSALLAGEFKSAQDQLIDSILVKYVIHPAIDQKMIWNNGFWSASDSTAMIRINNDSVEGNHITKSESIIAFSADSAFCENDSINITINSENLLADGVRILVREMSQLGDDSISIERFISHQADTLLFSGILTERLKDLGLNFPTTWSTDSSTVGKILFKSEIFKNPGGLLFAGYKTYLLKKIAPEILFSVLLLLLTITAFYLSYHHGKRQAQLAQMRNDFISNISHELRTPVSTVKVAIESLLEQSNNNPDKIKEYLEMASLETKRLEDLIGKVMNIAQAEEEGQAIFNFTKVDIVKLIDSTIERMEYSIKKSSAKINVKKITDTPVWVLGDPVHLQGVISNLIDNSLKYACNRNQKLEIDVQLFPGKVEIGFRDYGPGIPLKFHQKVFEKFFRIPSGNIHDVKGHGLGLSYCALVMKQHNGQARVDPAITDGLRMVLTLPLETH